MMRSRKHKCVELKDRIQAALYSEYENLTDEERERKILDKLMTSDSPIATFWRRKAVMHVADEESKYEPKKKS